MCWKIRHLKDYVPNINHDMKHAISHKLAYVVGSSTGMNRINHYRIVRKLYP